MNKPTYRKSIFDQNVPIDQMLYTIIPVILRQIRVRRKQL
jgi:hypothetical protein